MNLNVYLRTAFRFLLFIFYFRLAFRADFYFHVKSAGIVVQIPFVYTEEQCAVSRGDELFGIADKNKIVIVIADNGNQPAGRFIFFQFPGVRQRRDAARRCRAPTAQRYLSLAADSDALSFAHDPTGIRPTVRRVVRQNFHVQFNRLDWSGRRLTGVDRR